MSVMLFFICPSPSRSFADEIILLFHIRAEMSRMQHVIKRPDKRPGANHAVDRSRTNHSSSSSSSFQPLSLSPSYLTIVLSCTYLLAFSFLGSLIVVASTLIMCDCVDCCGFCRESVLLFYKKLEKYIVMSKNVAIFAQTINL